MNRNQQKLKLQLQKSTYVMKSLTSLDSGASLKFRIELASYSMKKENKRRRSSLLYTQVSLQGFSQAGTDLGNNPAVCHN